MQKLKNLIVPLWIVAVIASMAYETNYGEPRNDSYTTTLERLHNE